MTQENDERGCKVIPFPVPEPEPDTAREFASRVGRLMLRTPDKVAADFVKELGEAPDAAHVRKLLRAVILYAMDDVDRALRAPVVPSGRSAEIIPLPRRT